MPAAAAASAPASTATTTGFCSLTKRLTRSSSSRKLKPATTTTTGRCSKELRSSGDALSVQHQRLLAPEELDGVGGEARELRSRPARPSSSAAPRRPAPGVAGRDQLVAGGHVALREGQAGAVLDSAKRFPADHVDVAMPDSASSSGPRFGKRPEIDAEAFTTPATPASIRARAVARSRSRWSMTAMSPGRRRGIRAREFRPTRAGPVAAPRSGPL